MQRQRKRLQPRAHRVPKAAGIGLVFETDHDVIRVADDDHVARGLAPSPALGPEIERVVQVDVGQKRRDHRPLFALSLGMSSARGRAATAPSRAPGDRGFAARVAFTSGLGCGGVPSARELAIRGAILPSGA